MDRVKRIWYLSHMRAAKVQASLRIRAVSPEPSLLAHTSSESRGTFRQKARSLAPLNGRACAVKTCHDGMLEDTNSLDGAHINIMFSKRQDNRNANDSKILRSMTADNFIFPKPITELYKCSLAYSGPVRWGCLNNTVKSSPSTESFHVRCIKWLKA